MAKSFYFVAVVPPKPLYNEVQHLKEQVNIEFGSKAALRSPPHITIIPPFWWEQDSEGEVYPVLSGEAAKWESFRIQLKGFDCFKPRVIFIRNEPSADLTSLQQVIATSFQAQLGIKKEERPFHPHMTIAFKDLSRDKFKVAWEVFQKKEFNREWFVNGICLMQHREKRWEVGQVFAFSK
jgi:2'-5' RNA ligase